MRNHEVTTKDYLLNEDGSLREPGWSKQLNQIYKREHIKAPKFRIKEWDYYLVLNKNYACAFTLSDLGYIGMLSVSLLDFKEGWEHTESIVTIAPMGKYNLPETSEKGNSVYHDDRLHLSYGVKKGQRRIRCAFKNFYQGKHFYCDITLKQPPMDTMVIATPFETNKKAFYYNQKINCMPASGYMKYDEQVYEFNENTDFGTLDWGRGVWTYDNRWYWGSGNTMINGKPFGFNIGYGFGDTKAATENILFYDGVAHKLDDVTFHIPEDNYTKPWKFSSSDGRFEMDFEPILDRAAKTDLGVIISDQHQVFGRMTGTAILDDGTEIHLKDVVCFAEDVHNRY